MFTLIRCRCRHQCSLVYLLPTGSLKTMTAVWIPVVVATLVVSVFASSPYNIVWGYLQQYYQRQSFQPPPPLLTWRPTPVVPLRPWDGRYHYLQTPPSSSWAAPLTAPKGEGHSTTGTCRSIRSLSTTHLLLGSPLNPHPLPYRRPDHGIASAVSADVDAMVTSGPTSSKSPHSPQHNLPHRLQLPCPFTPLKWQGDKEAPPLCGWGGVQHRLHDISYYYRCGSNHQVGGSGCDNCCSRGSHGIGIFRPWWMLPVDDFSVRW